MRSLLLATLLAVASSSPATPAPFLHAPCGSGDEAAKRQEAPKATLAGQAPLVARRDLPPRLAEDERLPARVKRIVLHTLGNPAYDRPEIRFAFLPPPQTQALWKRGFGAHWIVWTDGTLWPRRLSAGGPSWGPAQAAGGPSWRPARFDDATPAERRRLSWEAAPVFSHLHNGNTPSLGIEVAHTGRRDEVFPEEQLKAAAWLVRTLLDISAGRLGPRSVFGHKDLDRRPAYVRVRCARAGCPVFVDEGGRAYRRRVDPPEALFAGLARYGVVVPRPSGGDDELMRAERLPPGRRPAVAIAGPQAAAPGGGR